MALEISTVGASVVYAFSTSGTTRPTTGFVALPDVNTAPEFDMSPETIDASNITDLVTRYIPGRQDPGGDAAFTLNHTNAVITAWKNLVTQAATKYASGNYLWWAYVYPDASDAYFWAGRPMPLSNNGISQNSLNTIPAHCVVNEVHGWDTKPTITTA